MEVQTVRPGVIYVVGGFSALMCPAKAVSLASTWVRTYWRSAFLAAQGKASFCSYSTSSTELICNYILEVILLYVAVLRFSLCIYDLASAMFVNAVQQC